MEASIIFGDVFHVPHSSREARKLASVEFSKKMMGHLGNLREGMSLNAVATHLNQMGVPTIRGGKWTAKAVSRIREWAA